MGGISILGTSGIVIPYSTASFAAAIRQQIAVVSSMNDDNVVLTTGGRSEDFAREIIELPDHSFIQMGDFSGYTIKQCARQGLKKAYVAGFITHDLDEAVRVGHRIAIMRDGKVIQIGTPEEIVVSPADDYVADFVKGISRLKVVQAKTIMQSFENYESANGQLDANNQSVGENELLSKLIELSKSSEGPLIVKDNNQNNVGVVMQSDLLKAVIEGGDGE